LQLPELEREQVLPGENELIISPIDHIFKDNGKTIKKKTLPTSEEFTTSRTNPVLGVPFIDDTTDDNNGSTR